MPHLVRLTEQSEYNGDIDGFMNIYRKRYGSLQPNLSELAIHDMPAGAGHKGGKVPKRKCRSQLSSTNENRIPLQTTRMDGTVSSGQQHLSASLDDISFVHESR